MRSDMYKLLHETTRTGSVSRKGRSLRVVDGESMEATRQSMTLKHRMHWGGKSVTLRMAPLHRYLETRVGKPWAETYAEIRTKLQHRDSALSDIWDYLRVTPKASVEDGKVLVHDQYRGRIEPHESYSDYYVHPLTGNLERTRRRESRKVIREARNEERRRLVESTRRTISHDIQLHLLDGHWYEVHLGEMPTRQEVAEAYKLTYTDPDYLAKHLAIERFDVVMGRKVRLSDTHRLQEAYGRKAYAAFKRQLSHRELKAHGLLEAAAA